MKNRRRAAGIAAGLLSASMLLTGTFAWRSISQVAKNEIVRTANPGGRLHDDFNGSNKDVYVENFFELNEGGQPIFARVRLDEYMETGRNAGDAGATEERTPLVPGTKLEDVGTWKPHIPGDAADPFHGYWEWSTGGKTVFMPTFNKNKDSLKADINGTWEGTTPGDMKHFDDYREHSVGATATAFAVYDNDDDDEEDADTFQVEETHTARETMEGTVLTMGEWKEKGCPKGPYWVWDVDGWAYWAQAIDPGETTGLLLDGIRYISEDQTACYYGINVVAQFATAGDWGSADGGADGTGDGFYGPDAGAKPTADALFLLNQAAGVSYSVKVSPKDKTLSEPVTVLPGESLELEAVVSCGERTLTGQEIAWTLVGGKFSTTLADGRLTVDAGEEAGTVLTIQATAWEGTTGTLQVTVAAPGP